jgi:hypothetical protein
MPSTIAMIGTSINTIQLDYVDICQYEFKKYLTDIDGHEIFIIFLETNDLCTVGTRFFNTCIRGEILFIKSYWDCKLQLHKLISINYNNIPNLPECIKCMSEQVDDISEQVDDISEQVDGISEQVDDISEQVDDDMMEIDINKLTIECPSTYNKIILSEQDRLMYYDYFKRTGIEFF